MNKTSFKKILLRVGEVVLFVLLSPFLFVQGLFRKTKRTDCELVRKILVLEPWGLGDLVMATSVIDPLRRHCPQAKIIFLCRERWAFVLPEGVEFVSIPVPWTSFQGKYRLWRWPIREMIQGIRRLRAERFDWILDARGDPRNHLLSWLINGRRRVGWRAAGCVYLLTDCIEEKPRRRHRIEDWKLVLERMGIAVNSLQPKVRKQAKKIKTSSRPYVVGIHPGASQVVRRWPLKSFASLIQQMQKRGGVRCVVFVSPDGYGRSLAEAAATQGLKVHGDELIEWLSQLDLLIGNDSGVGHLAAALGVPVVSIFGPGDPNYMRPWGDHVRVVSLPKVPCRPCWDKCRYSRPWCLEDLPVDQVLSAVVSVLDHVKNGRPDKVGAVSPASL